MVALNFVEYGLFFSYHGFSFIMKLGSSVSWLYLDLISATYLYEFSSHLLNSYVHARNAVFHGFNFVNISNGIEGFKRISLNFITYDLDFGIKDFLFNVDFLDLYFVDWTLDLFLLPVYLNSATNAMMILFGCIFTIVFILMKQREVVQLGKGSNS